MSPQEFDERSAAIASAYALGDARAAQRLGDELFVRALDPRLRRLSFIVVHKAHLRDDIYARALRRIVESWAAGKPVTWAMLETIVVRAAVDETAADRRHTDRQVPITDDDGAARDALLHGHGRSQPDFSDEVAHEAAMDALAAEFEQLGRPKWAAFVRAWASGHYTGPDIEHATGGTLTRGRARQVKMEVCAYVQAYHPQLLPRFAPAAEGGVDAG